MLPLRGTVARWLLCSLVALGLTLSGPAHHAWCHGEHGDAHAPCCETSDSGSPDDTALEADHAEHACALCLFGAAAPPRGEGVALGSLAGARASSPEARSIQRRALHSPECPRGPPAVV